MPWWSPQLPWNPTPPALPTGSQEVPLVTTNGMRKSSLYSLTSSVARLYHRKTMMPQSTRSLINSSYNGYVMVSHSAQALLKSSYHPQILLPARYPSASSYKTSALVLAVQ